MPRHRRTRRNNGAGLGAFLGSLVGAVLGGLGGVPLATVGSMIGGAVGGHTAAQTDRKRRGAIGGGVGGIGGPLFAALGGWIGGRHPDRKNNPSGWALAAWILGGTALVGLPTIYFVRKHKKIRAIQQTLPSSPVPRPTPTPGEAPYYLLDESRFLHNGGVVQGRIEEGQYGGETVYVASIVYTPLGGVTQPPVQETFSTVDQSQIEAWFKATLWLAEQYAAYGVVTENGATT